MKGEKKRRRKNKIWTAKQVLRLGNSEIATLSNGHGQMTVNMAVLWRWAMDVLRQAGKDKFIEKQLAKEQVRHEARVVASRTPWPKLFSGITGAAGYSFVPPDVLDASALDDKDA